MASTKYGLEAVKPDEEDRGFSHVTVYKVDEEDDGTVWVSDIAWFADREMAHAFCRAWNGEEGPK